MAIFVMELDDCIKFDGTTSELVYCSISLEPQTSVPKKQVSINGLIQAVEEHPCVWEYSIPDYLVKCLEAEEDNWYSIGMYLASQMQEIAKKNEKAANKLHSQLVKIVMEANLEAEDEI
ncbi:hypothetical protein FF38_10790 [Lucilia cuprina]|uniref:Uncharacterized protein n=1 Tax=Lucilia cuprina TaxID=7375 RepID=A0A0L0BRJ6_LUCCU|nr:hypothetical protein FF38_10790 [Lucilia cuprina]